MQMVVFRADEKRSAIRRLFVMDVAPTHCKGQALPLGLLAESITKT